MQLYFILKKETKCIKLFMLKNINSYCELNCLYER